LPRFAVKDSHAFNGSAESTAHYNPVRVRLERSLAVGASDRKRRVSGAYRLDFCQLFLHFRLPSTRRPGGSI